MKLLLQVLCIALITGSVLCTIDGLSFMDAIVQRNLNASAKFRETVGDDPCHPLYWYPRHIPEYCQYKTTPRSPCGDDSCPTPAPAPFPVPLPVPVPQPVPVPAPMPMPLPYPPLPPQPLAIPVPHSYLPVIGAGLPPLPPIYPPLPYGVPLAPNNPMVPVGGVPYPYIPPYPGYPGGIRQLGMVPGVPGIVSPDGGINVLPFSDAYSEMLQNHKQQIINRQLEKLVAKYDQRSSGRGYRTHRKYSKRRSHY